MSCHSGGGSGGAEVCLDFVVHAGLIWWVRGVSAKTDTWAQEVFRDSAYLWSVEVRLDFVVHAGLARWVSSDGTIPVLTERGGSKRNQNRTRVNSQGEIRVKPVFTD